MSKSTEFVNFVVEQMALAGKPTVQSMFGGYGLYLDNIIFAIIVEDRLYFKADTKSRGDFLDLGLRPFTYESNGKAVSMSYFEAPSDVYDDPEAMLTWTRKAIEASVRAKKPSTKGKT